MKSVAPDKLLQHYEVVDGAPRGAGRAVICALFGPALEEGAHVSQIFWYENDQWWVGPMIGFEAASLVWEQASDSVWVLGREGNLARIAGEQVLQESVIGDAASIGPFRRLRLVGGDLIAAGDQRSLYRWRDGVSERLTGEPAAPELEAESDDAMIEAIIADAELLFDFDGATLADLIAVGSDGALWRLGAGELLRIDSPTNLPLYSIARRGERYVVGGHNGLLLQGAADRWDEFALIAGAGDLCSLAVHREAIYVCDGRQVYVSPAAEAKFDVVEIDGAPFPAHALRSDGERLLSIAGKELFMTEDGRRWSALL